MHQFIFIFILTYGTLFSSNLWGQSPLEQEGILMTEKEDFDSANKLFSEARKDYLRSSQFKDYLRASILLADNYLSISEYDSCLISLSKPLSFDYSQSDSDSLLAVAYHKSGIAQYYNLELEESISLWTQALNIKSTFADTLYLIKGNRNIGNAYLELENITQAEKYLRTAFKINSEWTNSNKVKEAQLNGELGMVYTHMEDFDRAQRYLNIGENLYEELFSEEPWEINIIYEYQYNYSKLVKDASRMILYANKSIDLYSAMEEKYDEDYITEARSYNNLAIAYDEKINYKEAIKYYGKSLSIFENYIDYDGILQQLTSVYSNLSLAYMNNQDFPNALASIEKAINLSETINSDLLLTRALDNKSTILCTIGEYEQALEISQKAISLLFPEFDEKDSKLVSSNKTLFLNFQINKLNILNQLYRSKGQTIHLEVASQTIENSIAILDQIRNDYLSEESKSFLVKDSKILIEQGIDIYYELYNKTNDNNLINKSWELSEKAKSIILLDAIKDSERKRKNLGQLNPLIITEDSLSKEISIIEKQIFDQPEKATELNKLYLKLSDDLNDIRNQISKDLYTNNSISSYENNTKNFFENNDNNVIEYFLGKNSAYAFSIMNRTKQFIKLDSSPDNIKELVSLVRSSTIDIYKNSFDKNEKYQKAIEDYRNAAFALNNILIQPVISSDTNTDKLLIIPDGVLGYLPFDLLISEINNSSKFSELNYLVKSFDISYCYSLALLNEMSDEVTDRNISGFLAMAPLFESNDEVYIYGDRSVAKEKQPPLYFNVEEIESINTIMNGDIVTGMTATEEYFVNHSPDYKIIHLSTHGKANDEKGDLSYLAFTEIVDSTENEFVYNYDLYNLNLNADMVVLSACETGLGQLREGEGIISLARGFSYAGAKSIINTLWTINDYKTKEIMESFYSNIKLGQAKDNSLRNAKLKFIEDNPDDAFPFYWAAFIPVGDMSPIDLNQSSSSHYLIIGVLGILFFLISIYIFKKKSQAI